MNETAEILNPETIANESPQSSPASHAGTRTGKIARLPWVIRDLLNQRLQDGQPASDVLAWVNDLPSVKDPLTQRFDSQPITKQNLSVWRQGGFKDWELRQQAQELLVDLVDESDDLGE